MWEIKHKESGKVLASGEGDSPDGFDLSNRNLAGANLSGEVFNIGSGRGILFSEPWTGLYAPNSNLHGADFTGLKARAADFRNANLDGACFEGAKLLMVDFSNANLHGARMNGFAMVSADGVPAPTRTKYIGSVFLCCIVVNLIIERLVKRMSDGAGLILLAGLMSVTIIAALVMSVRDRRTREQRGMGQIEPVLRPRLAHANLAYASVCNAKLAGIEAPHANFAGADLRGANLWNANLVACNFAGADIRGVDFREALLVDANLHGVIYDSSTRWPVDFDPAKHGAKRSDAEGVFA